VHRGASDQAYSSQAWPAVQAEAQIQGHDRLPAKMLDCLGMKTIMSGTGNCYDNAPMESFWATLKTELVLIAISLPDNRPFGK